MGKVGAFLQIGRKAHDVRPSSESIADYEEFAICLPLDSQTEQASRCMNCGVAFCQSGIPLGGSKHAVGCPLHSLIPETNDLLFRKRFDDAAERLALTNPFPEFTGRVCPAPCETACNLGLSREPVTINDNERAISDYEWEKGIDPLPVAGEDARIASVIGSGPAGLAVAWELARKGWRVHVYERADRPGGLLMYGIPNMKLPKDVIDRRIALMKDSGIEFFCGVDAVDCADKIASESDVVVIAAGASVPRDVEIEGRDLKGIHFALDYLGETTKALLDDREPAITAKGKDVVVIGGGDTGTDCVACALRQGAKSVTQVIRAQEPPHVAPTNDYWPADPGIYSLGYGQREAKDVFGEDPRMFSMDTIAFLGEKVVEAVRIQGLSYDGGRHRVDGAISEIPAQLVLIAKGFTGGESSLFEAFGVDGGQGSEVYCLQEPIVDGDHAKTPGIYVAGDARCGSSLVVNAMADALECASQIEKDFSA